MNSKMMLPIELTKILYQSWEGQISISSQDSEIYGKCLNGPGNVTFKNGNRYQGNFYNGLLNGLGKFTWSNGIIYEGQFTDNRITGKGVYRWPDGSTYQGQVKDGLRDGIGKYTIDEAIYEGQWKEGKKHGKGKIIFKSGSIFQGDFKNDFKEGYGKMYYYPSGNYFEGEWKNDMKEGTGTMNWTDIREKYVGQWKKNHQEGWGIHIWLESKGEGKFMRNRYQGNWALGVREGFGTFYYANGSKYEGYWKDNMKEGLAFYTNQNGKTSLILFNKDRMIKSDRPITIQAENTNKVPNKKEVQPNYYSLCLSIDHFYFPFTPNLQYLYNYLLRNNTQLKNWYKGVSVFYDQQSEYSFCLNLEGAWKMIRSLKILGDFSLATFNRGLRNYKANIQQLLSICGDSAQDSVNFQDIYYKKLAKQLQPLNLKEIPQQNTQNLSLPFKNEIVHERQKNILFRQFVLLLVWMSFNLDPNVEKPQKSIEKLVAKITPFLDGIAKASKGGNFVENASDNRSSVSKAQKNITPFFKNINTDLLNALTQGTPNKYLTQSDQTIKLKDLLGFGKLNAIIDEPEYQLLEKIVEKYFDSEILNRTGSSNWEHSKIPSKILNIMNYELVEFEFVEIIYILFIKKLASHKETEENKKKYEQIIKSLIQNKNTIQSIKKEEAQYTNQVRYLQSKKEEQKKKLQAKRKEMEYKKSKIEAKQQQRQREEHERRRMEAEDIDVKDVDFQEEESEFEI